MPKLIISLLGILAIASLAGCATDTQQPENQNEPKIVKIWVIAPLSGPSVTYGEDELTIYQMAVNEFNTIHQDVQVQLIFEDGKCNGKDATSAVQKLIDVDKVQLVLGGLCSSEMLASAQITQPLHIVNLSAVGQSPEINTIGDYVYKMTDTTNEIKSLNSYLEHNQIAKIGIIYENTDYGVSFVNLLKEAYKRAIIFESKYESSEKDFNLLVKWIKSKIEGIEKLIIIPQSDDTFINLRKALDKNANDILTNQQIIGSYAIKTDNILKSIPELMEGLTTIYFPLYDTISDEATHFITALKKVYTINSTDVYAVIFKESIDLILRAIEAGNYTSVDAQHYLRSFNAENPIHGLWDYYFEWSVAVGLQLVPRQVKDGERVRTVL